MASNETPTPDLASVLSILAGLRPQTQALPYLAPSNAPTPAPAPQNYQNSYTPQQEPQSQPQQPRSTTPTEPPPPPPPSAKLIDPTTITDWSSGLRCVMKTVARHEDMLLEIRHMIQNQHENEARWFRSREALLEKQGARKEGQRKLDDVLKLVGGTVTEGMSSNSSPEEMKKELGTFDMKVHKAQTQMVREMMAALKRMGVPFFGTRSELVRITGKESPGGQGEGKSVIDEVDLIKLQRRMLVILEDLCSD